MKWLARLKSITGTGTDPAKPTEPGFAGFAGSVPRVFAEIQTSANDSGVDPDRCCWPHTDAMNTGEIDTMIGRLALFKRRGLDESSAVRAADLCLGRDRQQEACRLCVECQHLRGVNPRWVCGNWLQAGVALEPGNASLSTDFGLLMQQCTGFSDALGSKKEGEK